MVARRVEAPSSPPRGPSSPALVALDANGKVSATIALRALDGRWSPDGTRIAFVRDEPGVGRALYVAPIDGRTVTRLADHLQIFGDVLVVGRRDGARVRRARCLRGIHRRCQRTSSAATGADRGGWSAFEEVATVRWSPDGSLIAFTAGNHLYVVHPDGTSLRQVADGYDFAWSPDSRHLAIAGPAGPARGETSRSLTPTAPGCAGSPVAAATCAAPAPPRLSPGRPTVRGSRTSADVETP